MKIKSAQLWSEFKTAFAHAVKSTPVEKIDEAWQSSDARTEFYFTNVIQNVAKSMAVDYEREKVFRVDGVFYKKNKNGYQVPVVFIESENDSTRSIEEIYKLCSLNAPLKVILVCLPWNDATRTDLIVDDWQYLIDAFVEENQLIGYLGVIVADGSDDLKFHCFAYDEKGQIADPEHVLLTIY